MRHQSVEKKSPRTKIPGVEKYSNIIKKNRTTTRQPNVEDNLDSPKVKCIGKKLKQCVSVKEDIANFPKKSNNKTSVQMNMSLEEELMQKFS